MTRRGRPKKPGARDKYGKRTPEAREEEITSVAVEGRMRTMGLKPERHYPTFGDLKAGTAGMTGAEIARSDILGCPLNKLQHWGVISPAQAIAGHDFAVTLREYLATAKLQKPGQGKAGFIPAAPDNGDGPPVRGESKAKAYMEALAEIDRSDPFSGPSTTSVVWDVCINENDRMRDTEIGALRVGLNAIHRILYGRRAA